MNRILKRCVGVAPSLTYQQHEIWSVSWYSQAPEPEQAQAPELAKGNLNGNLNHKKPKYDQSLFKALFKTFFFQIWTAGILKLIAGESTKSSPFLILLIKLKPI